MRDYWIGAEQVPRGSVYKGAAHVARAGEYHGIQDRLTKIALDFAAYRRARIVPVERIMRSSLARGRADRGDKDRLRDISTVMYNPEPCDNVYLHYNSVGHSWDKRRPKDDDAVSAGW